MPHPRQAALTALAQLTTRRLAAPEHPARTAGGFPVLDVMDALVEVAGIAYAAGDDQEGALAEKLSKKQLLGRLLTPQEAHVARTLFKKHRLNVVESYGF